MADMDAGQTRTPPEPRPRSLRALVVTLVTAVALVAVGSYAVADTLLRRVSTTEETVRRPVRVLDLNLLYGDARISAHDGDTIQIRRRLTRSVLEPVERRRFAADTLNLTSVCYPTVGRCRVDYDIKVPPTTVVDVTTSFGRAEVSGLSGAVDLKVRLGTAVLSDLDGAVSAKTLHGELQATDIGGPSLTARSAGGDIFLRDVASTRVDLRSSGGDLTVRGAGENEALSAVTENGDITMLLPKAAAAHRVEAFAPVQPTIDVPRASNGPSIHARSAAGTVTIRQEEQ